MNQPASGKDFLFVVSRFNDFITKQLLEGATQHLEGQGYTPRQWDVAWVPGCFELPVTAARAAAKGYKAIIALGCVIRGDTPHFDYVCEQTAAGLMRVSLDAKVPCIFGVLTTDTAEQALSRCGLKGGHKGVEAARAALDTLKSFERLDL